MKQTTDTRKEKRNLIARLCQGQGVQQTVICSKADIEKSEIFFFYD